MLLYGLGNASQGMIAKLLGVSHVAVYRQGSRMKGCDPMRGPTLKKPLPAKPRFFRSTPERAEPISA